MNKLIQISFGMMIIALLVTSCSGIFNRGADPLAGTAWELLYIRKSQPLPGTTITIEFEDGEVRGRAGCNSYFGSYVLKGNEIVFGPIAMTEMACMEPEGVMDQEQEYLAFLSEVVTFHISDGQLGLNKELQDQLTFIPAE